MTELVNADTGPVVRIDGDRIVDWPSFHGVFAEAFGFPDFYSQNMDAWIDCLGYLDEPEAGMTKVHAKPGVLVQRPFPPKPRQFPSHPADAPEVLALAHRSARAPSRDPVSRPSTSAGPSEAK